MKAWIIFFHQARIQAVAEIVQPIHQQLMVVPVSQKIEKIFSHPEALAQGKRDSSETKLSRGQN